MPYICSLGGQKYCDHNDNKMIEVKDATICKGGEQLFAHLSFVVNDGEMVAVTGTSGSGKTTLVKALMGFDKLKTGHISIDGELLTPASAVEFRRFMSYVPQDLVLTAETVEEMMAMPFALKANMAARRSRKTIEEEWAQLALPGAIYDKRVSELSGGEKQRVLLSICKLLKKPVVICDEPTSALDEDITTLVIHYLRSMADNGASVVVVTHDHTLAEKCDKVIDITHYNNNDQSR